MNKFLFFVCILPLCGCVSQQAVQKMIDERITLHQETVVAPTLATQQQEITALKVQTEKNSLLISKSSAQVSIHQDLLTETFEQQKKSAEAALQKLNPLPAPVLPVQTNAPETTVTE